MASSSVYHPAMPNRWAKRAGLACAMVLLTVVGAALLIRPSNNRDWNTDQAVLAAAEFDGDFVTVRNVRNFRYRTESDFTPAYYDRTFDLRKIESVWFVVEPFGSWRGPAHTFLSFGFAGGEYLGISVEIRKEKGESFSPAKGLLRQYEVMYVVGDERDLVKLRSNFRRDDVYVYPMRATREKARELFVAMLERANALRETPEFYNTLTNTCTTNIVRHVNAIAPQRVPLKAAILFPGYSDQLAWDLGLIDTTLTFEEAKRRFHINARALRFADDPDFSKRIRE
ncbi:MAG: Lnb N-terminal periplasmic domain-containing protein [Thermoanaerobaculia bacterium]